MSAITQLVAGALFPIRVIRVAHRTSFNVVLEARR
jgi:hypothetical protein